ncbi:MAG: hypothetical protein Kow0098_07890 [Ignavibacteriaceae bacterium]
MSLFSHKLISVTGIFCIVVLALISYGSVSVEEYHIQPLIESDIQGDKINIVTILKSNEAKSLNIQYTVNINTCSSNGNSEINQSANVLLKAGNSLVLTRNVFNISKKFSVEVTLNIFIGENKIGEEKFVYNC